MTARTKLVVAYLGGAFSGWQRQPSARTVQGDLEAAVADLTGGLRTPVVGAGRTDAGVHAAGQVAHVDLPGGIPPAVLPRLLNARLDPDLRIRSAQAVDADFHARINAVGKHYSYRLRWPPPALPWRHLRAALLEPPPHRQDFETACRLVPGRRDWGSFTPPEVARRGAVRTVYRIEWRWRSTGLDLDVWGNGFVRYQVRRMVGALLAVGDGSMDPADFADLLRSPRPGAPVSTAPARGLTLERVYYRRAEKLVPTGDPEPRGDGRSLW